MASMKKLISLFFTLATVFAFSFGIANAQTRSNDSCLPENQVKAILKQNGFKGVLSANVVDKNGRPLPADILILVNPHTNDTIIVLKKRNEWCLMVQGKNLKALTIGDILEKERDA